ncbi:hypothetical protein [Isoalcanivorax indicus]|uniref:hypothetical protein n=1 Tax=Isoalcanivorax indicus TaxID=2202653 RepID=UPI0013C42FCD|nr:hypothetical protein [Isoalcanivorax indicus]
MLWPLPVLADGPRLALLGGDEAFQARFGAALAEQLVERGEGEIGWQAPRRSDLIVALGDDAFTRALSYQRPVIGVFVSRDVALEAYSAGCACTAFFAEADPVRQLRLARLMFPAAQRIGLVTGPHSAWAAGLLQTDAESAGLILVHEAVAGPADMARQLPRLLSRVDLLIAVGDSALYGPDTARTVLLTSYRQGRPVIGPDEFFVQAGSVATTYTGGADMVEQVADTISRFRRRGAARGRLPPPDFGSRFSVRVNEHVARTYDVPERDADALAADLEAGW